MLCCHQTMVEMHLEVNLHEEEEEEELVHELVLTIIIIVGKI